MAHLLFEPIWRTFGLSRSVEYLAGRSSPSMPMLRGAVRQITTSKLRSVSHSNANWRLNISRGGERKRIYSAIFSHRASHSLSGQSDIDDVNRSPITRGSEPHRGYLPIYSSRGGANPLGRSSDQKVGSLKRRWMYK